MDKKLEFNVNILDVSDVKEFLDFRKIREEDFPLIVKVLDIPTKFRKEVAIDYHNFYTLSGERSIVKILASASAWYLKPEVFYLAKK